jgi:hypothetical protein
MDRIANLEERVAVVRPKPHRQWFFERAQTSCRELFRWGPDNSVAVGRGASAHGG